MLVQIGREVSEKITIQVFTDDNRCHVMAIPSGSGELKINKSIIFIY